MKTGEAEGMAIAALGWLAGDEEALEGFLGATGAAAEVARPRPATSRTTSCR